MYLIKSVSPAKISSRNASQRGQSAASAQSTVPVRELSAAEATSTKSFGNLFNVRALPNGRLLVNDGVRRELVVLDQCLSGARIVVDSVADGKQGYGPRAAPLPLGAGAPGR